MTMWEYLFRWETLWWTLIALYIPTCLGLIALVLLQKGKGVGFAGAFGMGAGSEAVFGPRGSVNFPVRLTYILATVFMVLSLTMSLVAGRLGMGIAPEALDPAAQAQLEEEEIEGEGFGGFDVEDMDPEVPMEMPAVEDLEFTDPEADSEVDTEPESELTPEPEVEPEIEPTPEDEPETDPEGEPAEEEGEEIDPEADTEPEDPDDPGAEEAGDEEDAEADEDIEQTGEEESESEQQ